MHASSLEKMNSCLIEYSSFFGPEEKYVLDFGSYDVNGTYKDLFNLDAWNYTGMDLNNGPNVDLVLEVPHHWKEIKDNSFDLVISGQALEHCEFFWLVFEQIKRILKPGRLAFIIAPSSGPEHKYPVDCWRFYPDGMRAICKYTGLKLLKVETDFSPSFNQDGSHLWKDTLLVAQKPQS